MTVLITRVKIGCVGNVCVTYINILCRLRFAVVSEPLEEDDDCMDVGVAYVSIPDILRSGRNVFNEDIPS